MFQQIMLVGNVGSDPELRYTPSGVPVCNFRIAVNKRWTNQEGEQEEKTTWFRVAVWRKQAEVVAQYLTKGRLVMVVGEVEEANAYLNRNNELAASIEVTGRLVKFLGAAGSDAESNGAAGFDQGVPEAVMADIPF
jgi:single-strand DNA-binding protein